MRTDNAKTVILHFLPNRGIGQVFFVRLQEPGCQQSRQTRRSKNNRSYQMWEHGNIGADRLAPLHLALNNLTTSARGTSSKAIRTAGSAVCRIESSDRHKILPSIGAGLLRSPLRIDLGVPWFSSKRRMPCCPCYTTNTGSTLPSWQSPTAR